MKNQSKSLLLVSFEPEVFHEINVVIDKVRTYDLKPTIIVSLH